jgi:hypothetical protein
MGVDGTTNKQFSVSRETERPKHAQTSRQTDPRLTRRGRIGARRTLTWCMLIMCPANTWRTAGRS